MGEIFYNADEIFEIAIQIEKNGERFYAQASEIASEEQAKKILQQLQAMEAEHQRVFKRIYQKLKDRSFEPFVFDPEGQQELYLKAVADSHVFSADCEVSKILDKNATIEEIMDLALRFEKDSIVFFLGMKDIVPEDLGKDHIEKLIQEEQAHILYITEQLGPLVNKD